MRIDNIDWSDDYYNLTSSKSTLLATNISQIVNNLKLNKKKEFRLNSYFFLS